MACDEYWFFLLYFVDGILVKSNKQVQSGNHQNFNEKVMLFSAFSYIGPVLNYLLPQIQILL